MEGSSHRLKLDSGQRKRGFLWFGTYPPGHHREHDRVFRHTEQSDGEGLLLT
jgi:hypothetical protein